MIDVSFVYWKITSFRCGQFQSSNQQNSLSPLPNLSTSYYSTYVMTCACCFPCCDNFVFTACVYLLGGIALVGAVWYRCRSGCMFDMLNKLFLIQHIPSSPRVTDASKTKPQPHHNLLSAVSQELIRKIKMGLWLHIFCLSYNLKLFP